MTPHDLLLKVLEIIGYEDDKEQFIGEYLKNVNLQVVANLLQNLPEDHRNLFKEKLSNVTNPQMVGDVIGRFFSQDQLQTETENVSKLMFQDFVTQVSPGLSDMQKETLQNFLGTVTP